MNSLHTVMLNCWSYERWTMPSDSNHIKKSYAHTLFLISSNRVCVSPLTPNTFEHFTGKRSPKLVYFSLHLCAYNPLSVRLSAVTHIRTDAHFIRSIDVHRTHSGKTEKVICWRNFQLLFLNFELGPYKLTVYTHFRSRAVKKPEHQHWMRNSKHINTNVLRNRTISHFIYAYRLCRYSFARVFGSSEFIERRMHTSRTGIHISVGWLALCT